MTSARSIPPTATASSRSGNPVRDCSGLIGVAASRSESRTRSPPPCGAKTLPRRANSFITPRTLGSFVGAIRTSVIAARSAAAKASSTPWDRSVCSIASGIRSSSVAAGASSMKTGRKVRVLTNSATCGRQNSPVANQSPRAVVETAPPAAGAPLMRSRSFLVPRIMSIRRLRDAVTLTVARLAPPKPPRPALHVGWPRQPSASAHRAQPPSASTHHTIIARASSGPIGTSSSSGACWTSSAPQRPMPTSCRPRDHRPPASAHLPPPPIPRRRRARSSAAPSLDRNRRWSCDDRPTLD